MSKNWKKGEEITRVGLNDTGFGLKVVAQDPAALTVYINKGVALVEGTVVKYGGGNSPSIAAPSSNPRIDLITIDSAGTIALTAGSEGASPSAPAYPSGKTVLAEIYCRVGMTSITDTDEGAGQGYIYRDSRPLGASITLIDTTTGASDAGKGIKTNSNGLLDSLFLESAFGDGSDGSATISAPTTLTKDMYYTDLTVNDVLTTDGYRIYVSGTLSGSGTIKWGTPNTGGAGTNSAGGGTGGAGGAQGGSGRFKNTAGSAGGGGNGGSGGINGGAGNGVAGTAAASCLGSNASAGGAGGSNSGGAGGTATAPQMKFGTTKFQVISMLDVNNAGTPTSLLPQPGAGGGAETWTGSSGSGHRRGGGGGGGASGGTIWIAARNWAGTFTISNVGGNGGVGGDASGGGSSNIGGSGGAGGNGGINVVLYQKKTWTGSHTLTGGTGGAGGTGSGTGASNGATGNNGAAGTSYEFKYGNLL